MDGSALSEKKLAQERLNRSRFLDWMDRHGIEYRVEPYIFGYSIVHVFMPDGSINVSNLYDDEWRVVEGTYISYMNIFEVVDRILEG